MAFVDSLLVLFCLLSAFSIRLGYLYIPSNQMAYPIELWVILCVPLIVIPIFYSFGLYRSVTRYIGLKAIWLITKAVTLYSLLWVLLSYMAAIDGVPRLVILINWMIFIIAVSASRLLARWLFVEYSYFSKKGKKNIIIYGAGFSGMQLSQSLKFSTEYNHVAYIDDNISLQSSYVDGVKIYSFSEISFLIDKYNVQDLFLALPTSSRKERHKIISNLDSFSIKIKTIPSISDLLDGKVKIDDLREVDVKDLLGRRSALPNIELMRKKIIGRVVLVTGAGGSIGSELCRQIVLLNPAKLILFDISEFALYEIEQELSNMKLKNVEIIASIGSVRDFKRAKDICYHYKVNTIYHAAAYKHVPLVEYNQSEGVLNNITGTQIIAEVAIEAGVETFVLISTDKAVRPTNTMGATKRVAELILQAFAKKTNRTCFSIVRFGNVMESSGSVIPLFKKQIKNGGPITVTDKNIIRYFMTIPEAVELVIQSGAMGNGGEVFVLDMGAQIRIYDLAIKMINLSGLQLLDKNNPDGDIEIKFTGLRPGEKLYEELLVGEDVEKTENKLIMRANESMIDWTELEPLLIELNEACINTNQEKIRKILIKIVPEFSPQSPILDLVNRSS
jgi:FlaA1/EpsC-like NDP-sugar epimerase